ncbi:DeoR/GlpR transcriptional regulator [Tsukamurella asaccharolytica]|uniref:DeoR/GlpR transcriptional regulator n=1 Tax=Tsukamurella asaccharolytica TaxID=2592067 RepID=A0A5C5R6H5_9ACTN|nr:DeoR/GlpR family DNA-binding transcription regulator [Tsukamurella asaccharolytica]TWS18659.1 DeoR/GlpR transcriptional regulator [Tsukamurella asaccharolytica]
MQGTGASPTNRGRHSGGIDRAESRRQLIAETVLAAGSASPQELAAQFGVSIVTMHRDLAELERRGVVRKFRGGVTAQPSGVFESQMSYRMANRVAHKKAIANAALDYVQPGMSILLDDSTTVLAMLDGLAQRTPLHVATTFLTGLHRLGELSRSHDLTVIGLGGRFDPSYDSFAGVTTRQQVEGLHVDAVFMSTSAVSRTDLFHQEEQVASLKRSMLGSATEKYLLVDHSKLDRVALLKVASLSEMTLVLTDSDADPAVLASWREAEIPYRQVPVTETGSDQSLES